MLVFHMMLVAVVLPPILRTKTFGRTCQDFSEENVPKSLKVAEKLKVVVESAMLRAKWHWHDPRRAPDLFFINITCVLVLILSSYPDPGSCSVGNFEEKACGAEPKQGMARREART